MSDEWPKPWDEIRPDPDDSPYLDLTGQWVELGGVLRILDKTLYINFDGGRADEQARDLWMPLEVYLRGGFENDA